MITIAACGRADIVADVWFTDGRFETLHIGNRQPAGFVTFFQGGNIQAIKVHVENCVEDGYSIENALGRIVVHEPDRCIGAMLCVVGDKVEAFTANGSTWEWKR